MRIIDFKTYVEEFDNLVNARNEQVIITNAEDCILVGENSYNEVSGLTAYKTHKFGGCLVNFKEDVCLSEFTDKEIPTGKEWMLKLVNYLQSKGLNAYLDGNDVLVDGFKVGSYMRANINGCWNTACHISIGMDVDLIKQVCTKEMYKIPKGLKDYGITQQEIIDLYNK